MLCACRPTEPPEETNAVGQELKLAPVTPRPCPVPFPIADFDLHPFAIINHNHDHDGVTEFCESLEQIIESEGGFRGRLNLQQPNLKRRQLRHVPN